MSVWAVVVARVSHGAKSRLGNILDTAQRRDLAMAMLGDVLDVCTSRAAGLDRVVAVVDTPEAAALARCHGAQAVLDDGADMNRAVRTGLGLAQRGGARRVIVLPGDIPLLSAADLQALQTAATESPTVVIGASRDGLGTNALLLQPPDVIVPAFGPPSVQRHVDLAHAAGATARVLGDLGLALDVDTPAEWSALADLPVGSRTADLLAHTKFKAFTRI